MQICAEANSFNMKYLAILALAAGMLAFHPRYSQTSYLSVTGHKQGAFKGKTSGRGGREKDGWFLLSSFSLGESKARDQKKPVIIKKETDGASAGLKIAFDGAELMEVQIQTVDATNKATGT